MSPRYYSKTRWKTQPRDNEGKWKRVGAALSSTFKRGAGYDVDIWGGSAGGHYTRTKKLPGGYAITARTEVRVHPQNKSPFERLAEKAVSKTITSIKHRKVKSAVSVMAGRGPTKPTQSSIRAYGAGRFRSKTHKELLNSTRKIAAKNLRKKQKLQKVEAQRSAAKVSSALPTTITRTVKTSPTTRSGSRATLAGSRPTRKRKKARRGR